jgi:mono/diheme cytochrome c family protein
MKPFPHPRRLRSWLLMGILSTLLLTGCSLATQQNMQVNLLTPAPMPAEALQAKAPQATPNLANGAALYAQKCQPCHGDTGQGDGPRAKQVREQGGQVASLVAPDARSQATLSSWYEVVSNGRIQQLMPGFADSMTPQERWDVLGYVSALGVPSATLKTGQALYEANCAACHGEQGKGDGPQAGSDKLQDLNDPAYLAAHALNDMATAMQDGAAHQDVKLDDAQRRQVAEYLRSLGFSYTDPATLRESADAGNGVLRLAAQNMTPNGKPVAQLPVTLHAYDTVGEIFTRTATLDAQGVVTFAGLQATNGYFYQADVLYDGAKFYATPQQFSGTLALSTTLPVYEVTTDPSVITVSQYHYFVQSATEGFITVVEFYIFDNTSDRAYIDQPGPDGQLRTLKVTVPADAANLRFDGPGLGDRFSREGDTLYDSDAVPPGKAASTIAMIYELPYQGSRQISRMIPYPVDTWDVLLPNGQLEVTGLVDKGVQQMQDSSIHLYMPDQPALAANGTAAFGLRGLLGAAPSAGNDGMAIGIGLVALAVAGGLTFYVVARAQVKAAPETRGAPDRQALLQRIAGLDTRYAAGSLAEADYRQEREALKAMLRQIWDTSDPHEHAGSQ